MMDLPDTIVVKSGLLVMVAKFVWDMLFDKFSKASKSMDDLKTEVTKLTVELKHFKESMDDVPQLRAQVQTLTEKVRHVEFQLSERSFR